MEVQIAHSWQDVYFLVEIVGMERRVWLRYPMRDSIYQWNTYNNPPGDYKVVIEVINMDGITVERKEKSFAIQSTKGIAKLIVDIEPTYSYTKKSERIGITGAIINDSNLPIYLLLEFLLYSPKNEVVYSYTEKIPLFATETVKAIEEGFDYLFKEVGNHILKINLYSDNALIGNGSGTITVLPNIRVETKKDVFPIYLYPANKDKIKIIIELKGVKDE